eukprot:TRINITY_DN6529_c0_g1_i1.p1 TRINITY_DN6529_c0_g1~~TRINITY_DN6529_c0_g1_i1.p1  ORF type:complete len:201 (-),score=31.12 TRINITY_DN6529_c0_g1_i1:192-770(-)
MRSLIERYYEEAFFESPCGEDQYVNQHTNGICVVGVAPGHPIIAEKKRVKKVNFDITNKSRLDNKVVGKGKKGGLWLDADTPLCTIECDDGSLYTLRCCIRGSLLEVNDRLVHQPTLIGGSGSGSGSGDGGGGGVGGDLSLTEGFLAIVMPKKDEMDDVTKGLTSYHDYCTKKGLPITRQKIPEAEKEYVFE